MSVWLCQSILRPALPATLPGSGSFRRDDSTDAGVVEFRVTVAPAVVLLLRDLSRAVSGGLFLPGPQALLEVGCLAAALEDLRPEADETVSRMRISLRSSNANRVCMSPSKLSMAGTAIARGDTSSASAICAVRSTFGVRSSGSYCAIRTSALVGGKPSSIPKYFCVIPRRVRKKRIRFFTFS